MTGRTPDNRRNQPTLEQRRLAQERLELEEQRAYEDEAVHRHLPFPPPPPDRYHHLSNSLRVAPDKLFLPYSDYCKRHKRDPATFWPQYVERIWKVLAKYWDMMCDLPKFLDLSALSWSAHSLVVSSEDGTRVWDQLNTAREGGGEFPYQELLDNFVGLWTIKHETEEGRLKMRDQFHTNFVYLASRVVRAQQIGIVHQIGGRRPGVFEKWIDTTARHWYATRRKRFEIRPTDINTYLQVLYPLRSNQLILQIYLHIRQRHPADMRQLAHYLAQRTPPGVRFTYKQDRQGKSAVPIPLFLSFEHFLSNFFNQGSIHAMALMLNDRCKCQVPTSPFTPRQKSLEVASWSRLCIMTKLVTSLRLETATSNHVVQLYQQPQIPRPFARDPATPPNPFSSSSLISSASSTAPPTPEATFAHPDLPVQSIETAERQVVSFELLWRFSASTEEDRRSSVAHLRGVRPYELFVSFEEYCERFPGDTLRDYATVIWNAADNYWHHLSSIMKVARGFEYDDFATLTHYLINRPEDQELVWVAFRRAKLEKNFDLRACEVAFIARAEEDITAFAKVVANAFRGLQIIVFHALSRIQPSLIEQFSDHIVVALFTKEAQEEFKLNGEEEGTEERDGRREERKFDYSVRDMDIVFWTSELLEDFEDTANQYHGLPPAERKRLAKLWLDELPIKVEALASNVWTAILRRDHQLKLLLTEDNADQMIERVEKLLETGEMSKMTSDSQRTRVRLNKFLFLWMIRQIMVWVDEVARQLDADAELPELLPDNMTMERSFFSQSTPDLSATPVYRLPRVTDDIRTPENSADFPDRSFSNFSDPRFDLGHHSRRNRRHSPAFSSPDNFALHELSRRGQLIYKKRFGKGIAFPHA